MARASLSLHIGLTQIVSVFGCTLMLTVRGLVKPIFQKTAQELNETLKRTGSFKGEDCSDNLSVIQIRSHKMLCKR